MSKEKVIEICGDFPQGYVSKDYSSDPNFTFPKDLLFEPTQLWDIEGNSVVVNSFAECENYVSGGWQYDISYSQSSETSLQIGLVLIVLTVFIFQLLKIFKKNKNVY